MIDIFSFDTPLLASLFVLLSMSFVSLVFSLTFHLKFRAMRKLPENLSVNVFDKTFNVFDPYPSRRKTIHSFAVLLLLFAVYGAFILGFFVVAKVFEMSLMLGLVIFIICLNLMIFDETSETYKNANVFIKAIRNGAGLGKGDLTVLFLVKETIPKLSVYYLLLTIIFLASSVTLPYIMSFALTLAQLVGLVIEFTAFVGSYSFIFAPLPIIIATLMVQITAHKVKSKIFGYPSPETLDTLSETSERMKTFVAWTGHHEGIALRPFPEPEEALDYEREKSKVRQKPVDKN